jgi:hypothetical protein
MHIENNTVHTFLKSWRTDRPKFDGPIVFVIRRSGIRNPIAGQQTEDQSDSSSIIVRYRISWEESNSSYTCNRSGNSSCRDTSNCMDNRWGAINGGQQQQGHRQCIFVEIYEQICNKCMEFTGNIF